MLYHITKPENISNILIEGLKPDYKKGIGSIKYKKVFLTNDIWKIIDTQLGRNHWKEIAIIYIDTHNVEPHIYTSTGIPIKSDFEFVTDYIPPNDIKKIEYIKL